MSADEVQEQADAQLELFQRWIDAEKSLKKQSTPEGVPEDAQYLSPNEKVPEGAETFEGPGGGTYYRVTDEAERTTDTEREILSNLDTSSVANGVDEVLSTTEFETTGEQAQQRELESALTTLREDGPESLSHRDAFVVSHVLQKEGVESEEAEVMQQFAEAREYNRRMDMVDDIEVGEEFDGFEPFVVGGAVRDHLLDGYPEDIDMMAVPDPAQVDDPVDVLSERMEYIDAESAFPVFLDSEGREVALPRTEESTGEGFSDFEAQIVDSDTPPEEAVLTDLERRDMTLGSIAVNAREGDMHDPFDGHDSLLEREIEPVSEAFKEDPVRLMRTARFAPRFDLDVSDEIKGYAEEMHEGVEQLPDERIMMELEKTMYQADDAGRFFSIMDELDVLDIAFPVVDENLENVEQNVSDVSAVTSDENAAFSGLGAGLDESAEEFVETHKLSTEQAKSVMLGSELAEKDQFTASDFVELASRSDGQVITPEQVGDLMRGLEDDQTGDEFEQRLDAAIDAVNRIGAGDVMDAHGVSPQDIGDEITGEEFGQLVTELQINEVAEQFGDVLERGDSSQSFPSLEKYEKDGYEYPDAAPEDAPDEVQEAVERFRNQIPAEVKEDVPLLYWLLGTGTPAYKMSKEDSDYQSEPYEGQRCGNCEFYYESADGKAVCSQIRGDVEPEGWCRLWAPLKDEKRNGTTSESAPKQFELTDDVSVTPEKRRRCRPPSDAKNRSEKGGYQYSKALPEDAPEPELLSDVAFTRRELDVMCVVLKDWQPYEGPQGGQGWLDTDSGRVVYDDEPPGGDENVELPDDPTVIAQIDDPEQLRSMAESHDDRIIGLSEEIASLDDGPEYWDEKSELEDEVERVRDAREMVTEQMKSVARRADSPEDVRQIVEYQDDHYQLVRDMEDREEELFRERFEALEEGDEERRDELSARQDELEERRREIENNLEYVDTLKQLADSSVAEGDFEYGESQRLREELSDLHAEKRRVTREKQQKRRVAREYRDRKREELRERYDDERAWERFGDFTDEMGDWVDENVGPLAEREEELEAEAAERSEGLDELKDEFFIEELKGGDTLVPGDPAVGASIEQKPASDLVGREYEGAHTPLDDAWNEWFSSPSGRTKQDLLDELGRPEAQERVAGEMAEAGIEPGDTVRVFRGGELNEGRADSWSTDLDEAEGFARWDHGSVDTENNMAHGLAMMASGASDRDLEELSDEIHAAEVPAEMIHGYDAREEEVIIGDEPAGWIDHFYAPEEVEEAAQKSTPSLEIDPPSFKAATSSPKQFELTDDSSITFFKQTADRAVLVGLSGGEHELTLAELETLDQTLFDAHKEQVWADDVTKAPEMWEGDESVPGFVQKWIDAAIEQFDPIWDGDYSGAPAAAHLTIKEEIQDSLTQSQGWSINSIVERIIDEYPNLPKNETVTIVRQEVAGVLNKAREIALRAKSTAGEEAIVDWVGPDDASTTNICKEIKERVDERGGVTVTQLKDIIEQVATEHKSEGGTPERADELVPHYRCRHTIEESSTRKLYRQDDDTEWVPYVGPQGGTGWQQADDPDEVSYDDDPPGEIAGLDENQEFIPNSEMDPGDIQSGDTLYVAPLVGGEEAEEVYVTDVDTDVEYVEVEDPGGQSHEFYFDFVEDNVVGRVTYTSPEGQDSTDPDAAEGDDLDAGETRGIVNDIPDPGGMGDVSARKEFRDEASDAIIEVAMRNGEADILWNQLQQKAPPKEVSRAFTQSIGKVLDTQTDAGEFTAGGHFGNQNQLVKMVKSFEDEMPEHEGNVPTKVFDQWSSSASRSATAPLWGMAEEMTGNDNHHDKLSVPPGSQELSDDEAEALEDFIEYQREQIREIYGDEVTVWRGISGSFSRDVIRDGEAEHRAVESWSTNVAVAQKFGGSSGAVIEQTIDTDQILASHIASVGFEEEAEIVPAMDQIEEYDDETLFDLYEDPEHAVIERWMEQLKGWADNQ